MARIRCEFCHKQIDAKDIDEHYERHAKLRDDGQQTDYVTVAPDERFQGSLRGVPRHYEHQDCGTVTMMPEDIIRSYLVNPFLYSADATFCVGCGEHVPFRDCVWVETGEDLQTYTDRLRAKASPNMNIRKKKRKRQRTFWEIVKKILFHRW